MKKKILIALAALPFVLAINTAYADDYCGECIRATNNRANQTDRKIDKMSDTLKQAIDRARIEIIEAIDNSSSSQTDALAKQMSEQTQAQASNAIERERAMAQRDEMIGRPKLNCSNASSGSSALAGGGKSGASKPGREASSILSERYRKFMNESKEGEEDSRPTFSQSERLADIALGTCESFGLEPGTLMGEICAWIYNGQPPQSLSEYKGAATNSATIYVGPQKDPSVIRPMPSVPVDGDARAARRAAMAMVKDPMAPTPPTEEQMKSSAGVVYAGAYTAYKAMSDMASFPLEEHDRLTTDDKENIEAMNVLMSDEYSAPFINKVLGKMDRESGFWESEGISHDLLQFLEVERRAGNPDWYKYTATLDDTEKEAEALYISAYSLRLQREQLEASRQQNILLGLILQTMNNNTYRDVLDTGKKRLLNTVNTAVGESAQESTPEQN